jgi:hypothetical protein
MGRRQTVADLGKLKRCIVYQAGKGRRQRAAGVEKLESYIGSCVSGKKRKTEFGSIGHNFFYCQIIL